MKKRPPGPSSAPVLGNIHEYADDPFEHMTKWSRKYGEIVELKFGNQPVFMVSKPDEIKRILIDENQKFVKPEFRDDAVDELLGKGLLLSEGEEWREQRKIAQPFFTGAKVKEYSETMTKHAGEMLNRWEDGEVLDVESEMSRVTVKVIVDAMFGYELDDETTNTVQEALQPLGDRFEPNVLRTVLPTWVPTDDNRKFKQSVETLEKIVGEIADDKKEEMKESDNTETDGFLSALLRARDKGVLSDDRLRDEMITMLLAGHDTTALALTYTFYLLSQNPEKEEKVIQEVEDVTGDSTPTPQDVQDLEYTDKALKEGIRLYPPVYAMFREPKVGVRIGGYSVESGSTIMLPQWVTHRDPRYYDKPMEFEPERWNEERASSRPKYSYFPFGAGPRHCIGKQFSLLEAKLIMATVHKDFRLETVSDDELDLQGSITMHPREGIEMKLKKR